MEGRKENIRLSMRSRVRTTGIRLVLTHLVAEEKKWYLGRLERYGSKIQMWRVLTAKG